MIAALAALVWLQSDTSLAEAYFAAKPGTVRTYEQEVDHDGHRSKATIIETVGKPEQISRRYIIDNPDVNDLANPKIEKVDTQEAIVIRTSIDGREPQTIYYKIEDNRVFLIGTEKGQLLPFALPVLGVGKEEDLWSYTGPIMVMGAPAPAIVKGQSKSRKDYEFNGKKYPAIEVKSTYSIDLGAGMIATSEQQSIYARGIGLVEFRETGKLNDQVTKSSRKLTKIEWESVD